VQGKANRTLKPTWSGQNFSRANMLNTVDIFQRIKCGKMYVTRSKKEEAEMEGKVKGVRGNQAIFPKGGRTRRELPKAVKKKGSGFGEGPSSTEPKNPVRHKEVGKIEGETCVRLLKRSQSTLTGARLEIKKFQQQRCSRVRGNEQNARGERDSRQEKESISPAKKKKNHRRWSEMRISGCEGVV